MGPIIAIVESQIAALRSTATNMTSQANASRLAAEAADDQAADAAQRADTLETALGTLKAMVTV